MKTLLIYIILLGMLTGIIPFMIVILITKIPILIIPVIIFDLYFIAKEIVY